MKNVRFFVPVFLAIIIGSLTFIFAQTDDGSSAPRGRRGGEFAPPPRGEFRGGLPPHITEQLNLTDAQKEQVQAFELNSRDAAKEYFDKIRASEEQLRTMVESGAFNEEQARQILGAKAQAATELEIIRLRTDAAIIKLLTSEQKAQLEQLKSQQPPPFPRGQRPERKSFNN